jgi:peptide/nickel transport system permease protein
MPPFFQFLIRRFLAIPISLLVITLIIYGGVVLVTPPDVRASIYMPETNAHLTEEQIQRQINLVIERYHLNEPFPVQYVYWVASLLRGDWGYSPSLNGNVLPALLQRTPATAELALYSALLFIPLGLLAGVMAGWHQRGILDGLFRSLAFFSTSMPTFILALILISFFYIGLGWFAPERISLSFSIHLTPENFTSYTGMYTIDGLLNGRLDLVADAFRHLAMPVFTLSLYHWATLGRIARAAMIAERRRDYIIAARARGIRENSLIWRHAFYNMIAPSFTSLVLSAASLVTGVFVVEIIFRYNGVSDIIVRSMQGIPDAAAALGFTIYSVIVVLLLMFGLDVLQAIFDPRVRDEVLRS